MAVPWPGPNGGGREPAEPETGPGTAPPPHHEVQGEATAVNQVPAYDASARRGGAYPPGGTRVWATPDPVPPGPFPPSPAGGWQAGYSPYASRMLQKGPVVKARTIAAGVFVGSWLFTLSVLLVTFLLALVFDVPTDSFLPTTTTTVSLPTPAPGG